MRKNNLGSGYRPSLAVTPSCVSFYLLDDVHSVCLMLFHHIFTKSKSNLIITALRIFPVSIPALFIPLCDREKANFVQPSTSRVAVNTAFRSSDS